LKIYAEPSFLASLYIPDVNSSAALHTMRISTGDLLITALGELEVINAFGLRVFRREAPQAAAQSALANFEKDLREGTLQIRELSDEVFERARQLSRQTTPKLGTRAADLLHVAAAIEFGAEYLFSFDQKQRKLARSLHLKLN
jgi:predicted nucleic acid-binding protein